MIMGWSVMLRRLQNGAVALAGAFVPPVGAYAGLLALIAGSHAAHVPSGSPNPGRAAWHLYGPSDVLVHVEPWFAGTIAFWLYPWLLVLVAFVLASALWWPTGQPRRLPMILLLARLLGTLSALPWLYALFRQLFERSVS
jgi:hypothetical protein